MQRDGANWLLMSADPAGGKSVPVPGARQASDDLYYGVGEWRDMLAQVPPELPATVPDCEDPITVAKRLYTEAFRFDIEEPPAPQWLSQRFYAAIRKENRGKDGIGHLDYVPWWGTQDGGIFAPSFHAVKGDSENAVTVKMQYRWFVSYATPGKSHTVLLRMLKENGGCWKIDDFVTPIGHSLRQLFSEDLAATP